MKNIMLLNELLYENEEEIKKSFPEKVEGLVTIQKLIENGKLNEVCKYPIKVNNFFGVRNIEESKIEELKEAYFKITEIFSKNNERRVILARSLNFEEAPGKFSSYPSLFDPTAIEESFKNWYLAMRKVQDSGSVGVIAHVLSSKEEDFIVKDYRENWRRQIISDKVRSFGGTNVAFYIKSYSELGSIDPEDKSVCFMTRGLGAKITSGDKDIIAAFIDKSEPNSELRYVNLEHDYSLQSKALYDPTSVYVVKSDEPDSFLKINYDMGTKDESIARPDIGFIGRTEVPFSTNWVNGSSINPFRLKELFKLVNYLKKENNSEIELEGSINKEEGIYICQLRRYKISNSENIELSSICQRRKIIQTQNDNLAQHSFKGEFSFGNSKFEGPMHISEEVVNINDGGFLALSNGLYQYDFSKLVGQKRVCLIPNNFKGNTYLGQHVFGAIVNARARLHDLGIEAIILSPRYSEILTNPHKYFKTFIQEENQVIVPNVVLECNAKGAQIFYQN